MVVPVAVGGHDELVQGATFGARVAGVLDDPQLRLRPGQMQVPRASGGVYAACLMFKWRDIVLPFARCDRRITGSRSFRTVELSRS